MSEPVLCPAAQHRFSLHPTSTQRGSNGAARIAAGTLIMSTDHSLVAANQARGAPAFQIGGVIRSIAARISVWCEAWADKAAAAAMYEQLSRLSDAELHHRGLSRATLARDIYEACDYSKPSDPKTSTFW